MNEIDPSIRRDPLHYKSIRFTTNRSDPLQIDPILYKYRSDSLQIDPILYKSNRSYIEPILGPLDMMNVAWRMAAMTSPLYLIAHGHVHSLSRVLIVA
jgi:hypothetical protein